jgi:hypothetical protein
MPASKWFYSGYPGKCTPRGFPLRDQPGGERDVFSDHLAVSTPVDADLVAAPEFGGDDVGERIGAKEEPFGG